MQIKLDFRSGIPIYVQIMDQIKHTIATGDLQPGDQLPTVRQMAADLRVNFNTVARAYRLLDEAEIISTQHGRGTFILNKPTGEAAQDLRRAALDGWTRRYLAESALLGFSPAEVNEMFARYLEIWKSEGAPPKYESEEI